MLYGIHVISSERCKDACLLLLVVFFGCILTHIYTYIYMCVCVIYIYISRLLSATETARNADFEVTFGWAQSCHSNQEAH